MHSPSGPRHGEVIVHVFGRTDVGRTREHNEDAFVVADLSTDNPTLQPEVRTHAVGGRGTLFMVADGMGGAAAGEIASAMAVEVVVEELRTQWVHAGGEAGDGEAFARVIRRAAAAANQHIHDYASAHPEYRGMGTTATIAGLLRDTLYVAQVGDSRAYLIRDGVARQITKDQSLMQKLIEVGELTEEEAARSERRNIILQALGPEAAVKIDLTHQRVRRGDVLVLCSDGLSGQVTKDEIARVVSEEDDLTRVCKRLIDRANENGGPDNITVIVARFEGVGLASPSAEDEVGHRVYPLPDTGQIPAADRVSPEAVTLPMAVATPPDGVPPLDGSTSNAARPRTPTRPIAPLDEPDAPARGAFPTVSAARRSTGMAITLVLGAALLLGALWYMLHTARKVVPPAHTPPAGSPRV